MWTSYFIRGLILGFSIAAPVGPIGMICIRRSLSEGARIGLICGLGAATADGLYAAAGGFALSLIAPWLKHDSAWLQIAGSTFLFYLGVRVFFESAPEGSASHPHSNAVTAYASTLLLTLANPLTMVSFAAVFAGVSGTSLGDRASAALLMLGVLAGSSAWWLILSSTVARVRRYTDALHLRAINRLCGVVLISFAVNGFRQSWL